MQQREFEPVHAPKFARPPFDQSRSSTWEPETPAPSREPRPAPAGTPRQTFTSLEVPVPDATTGLGLVEDIHETVAGIQSGSWIDASLGGVGVSLEALSLIFDPLGSIVSWGVGWLLEHVAPLREALDQLAGDASAVAAHAATWENVAASLPASYPPPPADWSGAAADAYRAHAASQADALDGIRLAAGGIASAVMGTGLLVALVRELVRDLIADFVATLAIRLPQWLAVEGLTLGIATPVVAGQVAGLVADWAHRIQHFLRGLLTSLRNLLPKTDSLRNALEPFGMRSSDTRTDLDLARVHAEASQPSTSGSSSGGGSPSFTAPSGAPDPNRRPWGERTPAHPTAEDNRGLRRENESADLIAQHGYDIQQNPEGKTNGKHPDYKIEGIYFDCYAPTTDDLDQIRKTLSRKTRTQAEHLILYMDDTPRSLADVADILRRKPIAKLEEILVIQDNEIIRFFPFSE
ncbi:hypothetical protein [Actinoplanes sp. NPDC023714]|uniref:CdiA C-terminal domain-containing protein n=1 Tax=Actinoplanes sp. NPDC023714 TaxID=3154322 RepID=UPI0033CAF687